MTADERPTLLDLFGGRTGGAARGFQLAGWRVVSVDIERCPDNPADVVIQSDALAPLADLIAEYRPAAVHASPPCPGEGTLSQGTMPSLATAHPRLISPTRDASVRKDVTLCGEMFGLGVLMHRHFELGRWSAESPKHVPHRGYVRGWRHGVWRDGPYVAAYGKGGGKATVDEMREAKRIDWSRDHLGLRDALPPAYTRWIGERLLAHIRDAS